MRVMVIIKANAQSEAGEMPADDIFERMGNYNEELVNAGILLAGDGLHPHARGARVSFAGGKPTVVDGPYIEAREMIGGYWMWQVKSKEEAVAWATRCPANEGDILELRQVFDPEDFGPEVAAKEAALMEQIGQQMAENAKQGR